MATRNLILSTSSAAVSVLDSGGSGMPVLLIHGNSLCKEVFSNQLYGEPGQRFRLVAPDLPGHGESGNAIDAEQTYSIPGYARTCAEVLDAMGIGRVAVFGWSLGGHVALELARHHPHVAAAMIVGAPPFARGILGMMRAFQTHPVLYLATKGRLSAVEARFFARSALSRCSNAFFVERIRRVDPRARPQLLRSMMRGEGADQKMVAETMEVPLAVVNGSRERVAKLDYLEGLAYGNLWRNQCHVLDGAGHAPFLEAPDTFNSLFLEFLEDVSGQHGQESDILGRTWRRSA